MSSPNLNRHNGFPAITPQAQQEPELAQYQGNSYSNHSTGNVEQYWQGQNLSVYPQLQRGSAIGQSPDRQQQPELAQHPAHRHSNYPPYEAGYARQSEFSGANDIQPQYGSAPIIAELPAPLPPAPPTSTPAQQLNEDELLAHKLQQMEVQEAQARITRARSHSNLSQRSSMYPMSATSTLLGEFNPQDTSVRPHSMSVSSHYSQRQYAQAARLQQSPNTEPQSLAPEVVINSQLPEVVVDGYRPPSLPQQPLSPALTHPTAHLPPAPTDPTSLSAYLEYHRQVPHPPQWVLPPVTATYYSPFLFNRKSDWLDTPSTVIWHSARFSDSARKTTPAAFQLNFKTKGGSIRDPRVSWTLTSPAASSKVEKTKELWKYELKLDRTTQKRKAESLYQSKGRDVLPTYVHASNYDSLNFMGPDGRRYRWVSHAPVSSVNGARYDLIRHALFASTQRNGNQDPLYGQIVADHTYWDGYVNPNEVHVGTFCDGCNAEPLVGLRWRCKSCVDHDLCDQCRQTNNSVTPTCKFTLVALPDEVLYIRSSVVDVPMIIATLQILKDWEKQTLKREKMQDPAGFAAGVKAARQGDLGRIAYWQGSDFEGKMTGDETRGTVLKVMECLKIGSEIGSDVSGSGGDGGGSSSGGGDGGGGSSGGGGDGGGGGGGSGSTS